MFPWMLVALIIGVIVTVAGIVVVLIARKRVMVERAGNPNYYAFFIMGITWVPLGGVMMIIYSQSDMPFFLGFPFLAIGVCYLAIGLAHRDTWRK